MRIKGQGRLRHQFHGTYSSLIAIDFGNQQECEPALSKLLLVGHWQASADHPQVAIGRLTSKEVEDFKLKFQPKVTPCNAFKCTDAIHEIDGLDHSIDFGPPFTIEMEIDMENKDQMSLFNKK